MPRLRRVGKKIDFKQWDILLGFVTSVNSTSTIVGGSLAFSSPATILRMLLQPSKFWMDATKQADDRISLTWAIALLSTDAVALGATAVPDPGDEPEFPWLFWKSIALGSELAAAEEATGVAVFAETDVINIKSMRKVKPGESLVWVMQFADVSGAPSTEIRLGAARVLIGT